MNQNQKCCINRVGVTTASAVAITTPVAKLPCCQAGFPSKEGTKAQVALNKAFAKRIEDIDKDTHCDTDLKLRTYQEWVAMLVKLYETTMKNVDDLETDVLECLKSAQCNNNSCRQDQTSCTSSFRRDICTLLQLLQEGYHNDKWDLRNLHFETLCQSEVLRLFQPKSREGDCNSQSSRNDVIPPEESVSDMKALADEVDQKHEEICNLKEQVCCLEKQIQKAEETICCKDKEIVELRKEMEKPCECKEPEICELKQKICSLEIQNQKAQQTICLKDDIIVEQQKDLIAQSCNEKEMKELERDINCLRNEIEMGQQKISVKDRIICDLRSKITVLECQACGIGELKKQMSCVEEDLEQWKDTTRQKTEIATKLRQANCYLEEQLLTMQENLKQRENVIRELQHELHGLQCQIAKTGNTDVNSELEQQTCCLENELANAHKAISEKEQLVCQLNDRLCCLQSQMQSAQQQLKQRDSVAPSQRGVPPPFEYHADKSIALKRQICTLEADIHQAHELMALKDDIIEQLRRDLQAVCTTVP